MPNFISIGSGVLILWGGSNFWLSHKKKKSPLTQGLNYRSACDMRPDFYRLGKLWLKLAKSSFSPSFVAVKPSAFCWSLCRFISTFCRSSALSQFSSYIEFSAKFVIPCLHAMNKHALDERSIQFHRVNGYNVNVLFVAFKCFCEGIVCFCDSNLQRLERELATGTDVRTPIQTRRAFLAR